MFIYYIIYLSIQIRMIGDMLTIDAKEEKREVTDESIKIEAKVENLSLYL